MWCCLNRETDIEAKDLPVRSADSSSGRDLTTGTSALHGACSSHLISVILFFGSGMLRYLMPPSGSSLDLLSSLQYSVITPMLNPLIYSFKSKEVKGAVKRTLGKYLHYCTG